MKTPTTTLKGIFGKILLNKCFSEISHEIRILLMTIFFDVASKNDYLENNTSHADCIGYHLSKISISHFKQYLDIFFLRMLKEIKRISKINNLTLAFDETFIPYYGKNLNIWINSYTNNVKGATGSYKFMCCSVVIGSKKLLLYAIPMKNGDYTHKLVEHIIKNIKKYFRIKCVLFDRGFSDKRLVSRLNNLKIKYVILWPKYKNIKRHIKEQINEVTELRKVNYKFSNYPVNMRYVFTYEFEGHDWAMCTNIRKDPRSLVLLYKRRWAIETAFRVMDIADIKSKSTVIVARTFFFVVSILLYNLWMLYEYNYQCTFKTFVYEMRILHSNLFEQINQFLEIKLKYGAEFSQEEKKLLQVIS
jgi:putative transposase